MKKKIDRAITRKLDKKFDEKFWNKFDDKFSHESEVEKNQFNWQSYLRPVMMASVLVLLTFNLYSRFGAESSGQVQLLTEQDVELMIESTLEIDEIVNSVSLEFDDEFYALND
ncbi:hypothetical protein A9Q84_10575 [Halobacteriovorax marinus]|uniref:Uncharacterized protein n=1 Tax=Halobacteriovorax marinus TaxID=97084 RepID=A0A1Y5F7A2_9BACT|nr:hypothetical protein A9Q84_10575 [Halobacteriovorax marinus]